MIKDFIKEAFILKSKGYYKHAIEAFYKALELDNTSTELLLEIADIYNLMGEEERALNYIELILDKNPTHIGAMTLLKNIFIAKSAWNKAELAAKNIYSISNNPGDLASILFLLNKQKLFQEVCKYKIDYKTPDILYEIAYAKMFNNPKEAQNLINQALEIEPNNFKLLLLKGKILFKSNKQDECSALLAEMPFDNSNPDFLNFAGLVKQHQKDFKSAINYFKTAVSLAPNSAELYYNCGSTYFKMDEISLAKKYYNLAISLDNENPNYHLALANLYYSQKQYKRALEELKINLFEAKILKAVILYDTGFLAIAKKEFATLANIDANNDIIKLYQSKIDTELSI